MKGIVLKQEDPVRFKGIVFDMYGTVADLSAVTAACQDLVEDAETFGTLWRRKQLEYTFLVTMMGDYKGFLELTRSALDFTCEALGAGLSDEEMSKLMQQWLEPSPYADAVGGLERLRGTCPLMILSNGTPDMLRLGLEHAGLDEYFDAVLSVEEVRAFKPDPRVYNLAHERVGAPREEILFVSSNSFDVVGARKYGFYTAWIKRLDGPLDPLGFTPNRIVTDFRELAELVF